MKNVLTILLVTILFSCSNNEKIKEGIGQVETQSIDENKIKVLNMATFHMGFTNDANSVEYDERNLKNKKEIHSIAKLLSAFKPTVIILESSPEYNEKLQKEYKEYKNNPKMEFKNPSEGELLGYELGRISNVNRIYGIDHKMGYNYRLIDSLAKSKNEKIYLDFMDYYGPISETKYENGNTLEKLKMENKPEYLDYLIAYNADIMTHISTKNKFEGADVAAKYYQRNLRMYSNLNKISLTQNDRVFILMGSSHIAFFRDFMRRSPKYNMVDVFEYLK
ncbi:DUF5694 domain-containing protein [Maribacter ulvicola]|uniref:Uncharacterized protein n=1 Tax=Maribacter ulvicola TaxID=228959 RepID=A0A1N6W926_9FLAO|nr:DUF5694 domain-containing protein [Maribacter ulvicola]SIQ86659.1 hypothetical protein SAMN05421797_1046 [Maribacter ulvicola]